MQKSQGTGGFNSLCQQTRPIWPLCLHPISLLLTLGLYSVLNVKALSTRLWKFIILIGFQLYSRSQQPHHLMLPLLSTTMTNSNISLPNGQTKNGGAVMVSITVIIHPYILVRPMELPEQPWNWSHKYQDYWNCSAECGAVTWRYRLVSHCVTLSRA